MASLNPDQAPENPLFAIYDNELSPAFCRDVIRRFEDDSRKVRGLVGGGGKGKLDPAIKSTTEILLWTNREGWEDVNEVLMNSLRRRLKDYMKTWGAAFPIPIAPEEPRVTRYQEGEGFFLWHSDNIGRSPTRVITAIWYLNTVARGGETDYRWQNVAIQPVEGRMTLCPVGWPFIHRGNPPLGGPKYILITQLHQQSPTAEHTPHEAAG